MSRNLVWFEQQRFQGFGCSECGWRFKPAGRPPGMSLDEVMNNFELQRATKSLPPVFALITPRANRTSGKDADRLSACFPQSRHAVVD